MNFIGNDLLLTLKLNVKLIDVDKSLDFWLINESICIFFILYGREIFSNDYIFVVNS